MIHFTYFQTSPKIPKNLEIGSKVFYYCTRLPCIKTAIEELLTTKLLKFMHGANGSLSYLKSFFVYLCQLCGSKF